MLRWLKRITKTILWLVAIAVLTPIAGLSYGFLTTPSPEPLAGVTDGAPPKALADKVRAEIPFYQQPRNASFLAYPQQATIHTARDYAGFVAKDQPSGFPYWSYIGGYWQGHAAILRASSAEKFNYDDQLVPLVTGTGYTLGYALQWAYENTVGRITEAAAGKRTAADIYQAKAAADYAGFLAQSSWYQFPYAEKRAELFAVQPSPGDGTVRNSERKLAFGFVDTVKQGSAYLTAALTSPPDPTLLDIHVWAKGPVGEATREEADTLLERDFGADGTIFITRRGQPFTDMIPRLIDKGISFVEIGGNNEIMLTVLSAAEFAPPEGSRVLFSQPVPVDPVTRRTALVVAVRKLHIVLPALFEAGAKLEHVYDD